MRNLSYIIIIMGCGSSKKNKTVKKSKVIPKNVNVNKVNKIEDKRQLTSLIPRTGAITKTFGTLYSNPETSRR